MIYDEQIFELLENEVPEIKNDFNSRKTKNFISGLKLLATCTVNSIEKGSVEGVRKCFALSELLMKNGSRRVKSVLMVQFFTRIFPMLKPETKQTHSIKSLLSGHLLAQYNYSVTMDKW